MQLDFCLLTKPRTIVVSNSLKARKKVHLNELNRVSLSNKTLTLAFPNASRSAFVCKTREIVGSSCPPAIEAVFSSRKLKQRREKRETVNASYISYSTNPPLLFNLKFVILFFSIFILII